MSDVERNSRRQAIILFIASLFFVYHSYLLVEESLGKSLLASFTMCKIFIWLSIFFIGIKFQHVSLCTFMFWNILLFVGNADGMGNIRKEELYLASAILKVSLMLELLFFTLDNDTAVFLFPLHSSSFRLAWTPFKRENAAVNWNLVDCPKRLS